ncbi:MAG: glycosyl hydrolase [Gemmatimonadota bacterium]|nr:glycosyl hydrolase [Gemmatimonadota bacterium]
MSPLTAATISIFRRLPATLSGTMRARGDAAPRPATLLPLPTATALAFAAAISAASAPLQAQSPTIDETLLSALELRGIGPAFMSGRIADVAVDPTNRSVWYVATSSSNVWKTENRGTTWTPIFDDYPAYSTGSIAIDPTDSNVIWLGTGENTSQRSVGWGDGVYKSLDGGRSWTNTGLRTSEHIGQILIDPRDPDVVYAAAMGGLWAPGGDRGLFKTTDGGATWAPVLEISENTGIADVAMDPRDPDVLYAVAFQRRRHVGVLVAGGPESGVWKSTDGGETWRDITRGLPAGDLGRIALAVSPIDPDVLYANAAATEDNSGFYRSPDRGETWVRMSDYIVVDPQYYGELYPDPHRMDRVYAVDVIIHVTNDGGRTFDQVNTRFKHVDNHEIVFDPDDPDYMLVGSDGGLYETFDGTRTWRYVSGNMPLMQFYRVGIDNMSPFYTVYGGTQDNSSVGGPSRTDNVHGIRNSDWFITHGGDGFQARVDPNDPNIVYTQSQYAGIVRYDRASGEELDIQPQPEAGEGALRWHWDSPLIISPHNSRRIYFAAQKLFRSDDRAETWTAVSGDLSRGLDRNQRPVMGRIWPPEAVWKNVFTSPYGTIVALDESPLVEGLLYVGTDDGLVQVSEDGGGSWHRHEAFPAVPASAYVADVVASRHVGDRVYAVFNNHKEGDFAPYVVRSDDRGASWTNITGDVPDGQSSWTLMEDHVEADLLFLGTEFGLFVTRDGGTSWVRLRGGLPTIAVRDLEIQRREDDLVLATFGRGFYILDDYSPLREMDEAVAGAAGAARQAYLFPVKDPWAYIPARPLGGQQKGTFGDSFFTAPNPPFGAVFTYYLPGSHESLKERRQRLEREALARGEDIAYPDQATLTAEDMERAPEVFVVVSDADGEVVRRVPAPRRAGLHRIAWDLRYASLQPPSPGGGEADGPMVAPGEFSARVVLTTGDGYEDLTAPQSFTVRPLGTATLAAADRDALLAFQREVAELQRAAVAVDRAARETSDRLALLRRAVRAAPGLDAAPYETRITAFEARLFEIRRVLSRDRTALDRAEFAPPSVMQRVSRIVGAQFRATSAPTTTQQGSYTVASAQLAEMSEALRALVEGDLATLEAELEAAGVPWTPGRPIPRWPR